MEKSLTVFNADVIPVYITDSGEKIVIGRELHERLKIDTPYTQWFERMCAYGFTENEDYIGFSQKSEKPQGGRPTQEHYLKLDMAKHLAMIQRTPEGKAIRQKLIELETNISQLSPELRALIAIETRQNAQEKALAEVNHRLDSIGEILALSPTEWRKEASRIVSKIAQRMGGVEHIQDVYHELYKLVDERAGASLSVRLTNLRRRQAENGVCKSRIDKLNKLDVIAEDKRLKEIFLAVTKELAVKNNIDK